MWNIIEIKDNEEEFVYCFLAVKDKTTYEVQNKINEIKSDFYENDIEYFYFDIFNEFPQDWQWAELPKEIAIL